jgi:hypothetical protein
MCPLGFPYLMTSTWHMSRSHLPFPQFSTVDSDPDITFGPDDVRTSIPFRPLESHNTTQDPDGNGWWQWLVAMVGGNGWSLKGNSFRLILHGSLSA